MFFDKYSDKSDSKSFVCKGPGRFAKPLFAGSNPAAAFSFIGSETAVFPLNDPFIDVFSELLAPAICPLPSVVIRCWPHISGKYDDKSDSPCLLCVTTPQSGAIPPSVPVALAR